MDGSNVATRLHWALKLARLGFGIFPLKPGSKEPANAHGFKDATTDELAIRAMFESMPDMNYGVSRGGEFIVADIDVKNGGKGDVALAELQGKEDVADWITDGATFTVKTPSGGWHYYMKTPVPYSSANVFPADIDTPNYVVGPGSVLLAGKCKPTDVPGEYEVENNAPVMAAPAWTLPYLRTRVERDRSATVAAVDLDQPANVDRAREWLRMRPPAIEGQHGDEQTKVTADHLGDLGVSDVTALELMLAEWNENCLPPWDAADLAKKVENSYAYRERPLGCKATDSDAMDEAMVLAQREHSPAPDLPDEKKNHEVEQDAARKKRIAEFGLTLARDFIHADPPDWLFEGLIPRVGVGILTGPKGVFKTFIGIDLGCSAVARIAFAAGNGYDGFTFNERPGDLLPAVVHVAGEGRQGVETVRIPGWAAAHGLDAKDLAYIVSKKFPKPGEATDRTWFRDAIKESLPPGYRCAMVLFDTTARLMRGLDENSAKDAGAAIETADYLSEELGCFIMLIHHTSKDEKRYRGSSVLEDDPSVSLRLEKTGDPRVVRLTNPFQRDADEAPEVYLRAVERTDLRTLVMERTGSPKGGTLPEPHVELTALPGLPGDVARALVDTPRDLTTEQLASSIAQARGAKGGWGLDKIDAEQDTLKGSLGRATRSKGKLLADGSRSNHTSGLSRFFVREDGGKVWWRMPRDLMARAAPATAGDGEFDPDNP